MKKKIIRSFLIIFLMLPLLAAAHFFIFPQETRCILIRFADFDKQENIYFRHSTKVEKINTLLKIRSAAEERNNKFWKNNCLLNYRIIYCNTEKDFNDYGHPGVPAVTQLKMGACVVLKDESLDIDILAHEIAHTVLYNNIGWYKTMFKIPIWFNEGLAMQVDGRSYYSIDTLLLKKKNGLVLPDVMQFKKTGDFFSGTSASVMLNYATAKFVVHEWLKTHSLKKFINAIDKGENFETAYAGKAEQK